MIFNRIARGAQRSAAVLRAKLDTLGSKPLRIHSTVTRRVAMVTIAIRFLTLPAPVSAAAHTTPELLGGEDSDPLSSYPLVLAGGTYSKVNLIFDQDVAALASPIVSEQPTLASVEVGVSRSEALAEQVAKEAALKAEQEKAAQAAKAAEAAAAAVKAVARVAPVKQAPVSGNYDALFQKYFGANWKMARAICTAESGLNPNAVSRTNDHGLCQVNWPSHYNKVSKLSDLYDPEINLQVSARISGNGINWNPWTVYKTGAYLKFYHD